MVWRDYCRGDHGVPGDDSDYALRICDEIFRYCHWDICVYSLFSCLCGESHFRWTAWPHNDVAGRADLLNLFMAAAVHHLRLFAEPVASSRGGDGDGRRWSVVSVFRASFPEYQTAAGCQGIRILKKEKDWAAAGTGNWHSAGAGHRPGIHGTRAVRFNAGDESFSPRQGAL